MSNIIGKLTPQADGTIKGYVKNGGCDLSYEGISLEFWLETNLQKKKDAAPDFEVFARAHGKVLKVGAAWQKTDSTTGENFLQLTFDDRSLPKKIFLNAYADPNSNTGLVISDSRVRQERAA